MRRPPFRWNLSKVTEEVRLAPMTARQMVEEQIVARGVRDERVLDALLRVPREVFVPSSWRDQAYADRALPIGHRQTISQPYIVARMTELLGIEPTHRVLEVGTGSGYQTAILAELAQHVYTLEVLPELARISMTRLAEMGYLNVSPRVGNGHAGWLDESPFDRVIATAAPDQVPSALVDQLVEGGRLVLPVGSGDQTLVVVEKRWGEISQQKEMRVRFVPMTGNQRGCEEGGME